MTHLMFPWDDRPCKTGFELVGKLKPLGLTFKDQKLSFESYPKFANYKDLSRTCAQIFLVVEIEFQNFRVFQDFKDSTNPAVRRRVILFNLYIHTCMLHTVLDKEGCI